jgi:Fic-DOC domain mobile mystery protein B
MGLIINYTQGQTPLDDEERKGLKILSISNRQELDEYEQNNIEVAIEYFYRRRISLTDFLTEKFIRKVHYIMFNQVWSWAGYFRLSDKSIGVSWSSIPIELKVLMDDCNFWVKEKIFSDKEIAVRYSHRIVKIHPFVNGNGRHSRLLADLMMEKIFNKNLFSWANIKFESKKDIRLQYIQALRQADQGNYNPLLEFVDRN